MGPLETLSCPFSDHHNSKVDQIEALTLHNSGAVEDDGPARPQQYTRLSGEGRAYDIPASNTLDLPKSVEEVRVEPSRGSRVKADILDIMSS